MELEIGEIYKTKMSDGSMFKVVSQTDHIATGYYLGREYRKCPLDKDRIIPTPIHPDEWFPHWWEVRISRFATFLETQQALLQRTNR